MKSHRTGIVSAIVCVMMIGSTLGAQEVVKKDAVKAKVAHTAELAPEGFKEVACAEAPESMSCVPGGAFTRGTNDRDENARPAAQIWLTTFYMDRHEVTNAEYKACVKRGACDKAGPRYRGYHGDAQPITGVSWHDAVKYCEAVGKHLPTEAQWEKAARGPSGELNPWGDEPATCERAIIEDETGRSCGVKKPGSKPDAGRIFDVGSRPAGRYELHDMVGNAEEWVLDWYSKDFEACGAACQGLDPKGPCDGAKRCKGHRKRVLKGGSWYWPESHATGLHRRANSPSNKPYHHFGFRCAASVEEVGALLKTK